MVLALSGSSFFSHPEPCAAPRKIIPLFLPFAGCPRRCVFCSQELQTGTRRSSIADCLRAAEELFRNREAAGRPAAELAFYGGTFTALPPDDLRACLEFAQRWQARGALCGVRCSTRPDAVTAALLGRLRAAGVSTVELGVQSFHASALAASGRGYTGGTARNACHLVRQAGLELGIQLLPGMPGLTADMALEDVRLAARLRPAHVRLYPCQVFRGTPLANLWRDGAYRPWDLVSTLAFLARGCLLLWESGVPVIRMGVAPEAALEPAFLAGPRHACLGTMARSMALALHIAGQVDRCAPSLRLSLSVPEERAAFSPGEQCPDGASPLRRLAAACLGETVFGRAPRPETAWLLHAPRRYQGEFWGYKSRLEGWYAELGIVRKRVFWEDRPDFLLVREDGGA